MKKFFLVTIITANLFLLCAAMSTGNDVSSTREEIIRKQILEVQEEMKAAAENFHPDELFNYVLDVNDVIIENGLLRTTRKDALNITRQGFEGIKELIYTYNHKNIRVISPSTVLWTATGTTTFALEDGREITRDFAETLVFVLQDGQWKVLHAHRSSPN